MLYTTNKDVPGIISFGPDLRDQWREYCHPTLGRRAVKPSRYRDRRARTVVGQLKETGLFRQTSEL